MDPVEALFGLVEEAAAVELCSDVLLALAGMEVAVVLTAEFELAEVTEAVEGRAIGNSDKRGMDGTEDTVAELPLLFVAS